MLLVSHGYLCPMVIFVSWLSFPHSYCCPIVKVAPNLPDSQESDGETPADVDSKYENESSSETWIKHDGYVNIHFIYQYMPSGVSKALNLIDLYSNLINWLLKYKISPIN